MFFALESTSWYIRVARGRLGTDRTPFAFQPGQIQIGIFSMIVPYTYLACSTRDTFYSDWLVSSLISRILPLLSLSLSLDLILAIYARRVAEVFLLLRQLALNGPRCVTTRASESFIPVIKFSSLIIAIKFIERGFGRSRRERIGYRSKSIIKGVGIPS